MGGTTHVQKQLRCTITGKMTEQFAIAIPKVSTTTNAVAISMAMAMTAASTMFMMARAPGHVAPSTAGNLEWQFLNEYQSEGWLCGKHLGDMSIAPDGTRVANPA